MKLPRLQFSLRSLLLTAVLAACVGYLMYIRNTQVLTESKHAVRREMLGRVDHQEPGRLYFRWDATKTICHYWIPAGREATLNLSVGQYKPISISARSVEGLKNTITPIATLRDNGFFKFKVFEQQGILNFEIEHEGKTSTWPVPEMKAVRNAIAYQDQAPMIVAAPFLMGLDNKSDPSSLSIYEQVGLRVTYIPSPEEQAQMGGR